MSLKIDLTKNKINDQRADLMRKSIEAGCMTAETICQNAMISRSDAIKIATLYEIDDFFQFVYSKDPMEDLREASIAAISKAVSKKLEMIPCSEKLDSKEIISLLDVVDRLDKLKLPIEDRMQMTPMTYEELAKKFDDNKVTSKKIPKLVNLE